MRLVYRQVYVVAALIKTIQDWEERSLSNPSETNYLYDFWLCGDWEVHTRLGTLSQDGRAQSPWCIIFLLQGYQESGFP